MELQQFSRSVGVYEWFAFNRAWILRVHLFLLTASLSYGNLLELANPQE